MLMARQGGQVMADYLCGGTGGIFSSGLPVASSVVNDNSRHDASVEHVSLLTESQSSPSS